jgi:O-antigen/teichoic acid export membrane protein
MTVAPHLNPKDRPRQAHSTKRTFPATMRRMDWKKTRRNIADTLTRALKLDVRFYSRSFVFLSFGHVSGVIRGVATTFLMARWLDPIILGQFRYILAAFGMAGIFAMNGMSSAVIRGVAQGDTVIARLALRRILLIAPLGSLALLLAAGERLLAHEPTVAMGLALAAIAFTPYCACGLYGSILTGQQKIKELSQLAVLNNLVFAIAFVVILRMDRSLFAITIAYFGFDLLIRGLLTIRELRRLPATGDATAHLSLGNHLSGIGVMQTIAAQLDQILIQRFAGYQTLALYSVATVIPEQIKDMINGLNGTLLQRMSRHEKTDALVRTTQRHFWMVLAGSAGVVGAYALVVPWALPWLFPKYEAAVIPSMVYAVGLLALPANVGIYFFQAHQELGRLWRFYMTNSVLQIATNLALIPFFGSWGAIWSKTATRLAGLPLSYPTSSTTPPKNRD